MVVGYPPEDIQNTKHYFGPGIVRGSSLAASDPMGASGDSWMPQDLLARFLNPVDCLSELWRY
jgi:hypothetical protein